MYVCMYGPVSPINGVLQVSALCLVTAMTADNQFVICWLKWYIHFVLHHFWEQYQFDWYYLVW